MSGGSFCDNSGVLTVFWIFKIAIAVIQIGAPILLIIMCMLDVAKLVVSNDVDMKKAFDISKNRIIAAAMIFLLPTIIDMVLINIADIKSFMLTDCYMKSTTKNIELTKTAEKAKRLALEKEMSEPLGPITLDGLTVPVDSSKTSGDLVKFIMAWEGTPTYCDKAKTQYKGVDVGDGIVTVGYGMNKNDEGYAKSLGLGDYYPLVFGKCYPATDFDKIFAKTIEEHKKAVEKAAKKLGITLSSYQVDALTSYRFQKGSSHITPILKRYIAAGNYGVLQYMIIETTGKYRGLYARRDGEYELFLTGVYTTDYYGRKCKYIKKCTGGYIGN